MKEAILAVEGVLSLHELHVWQLSETKLVASVHVLASRNHDFMPVAAKIRKALHHLGIHSSTIQPEYHGSETELPQDRFKVCSIALLDTLHLHFITCPLSEYGTRMFDSLPGGSGM